MPIGMVQWKPGLGTDRPTVTFAGTIGGPRSSNLAMASKAVGATFRGKWRKGVKKMRTYLCWLTLIVVVVTAELALAAVDLVTLPTREGTQLTIYNSEDITMVREHRLLTVKEGVNRIQFSWANTLIDPTSIEFRILDKQDKVDLVDTTFPAGRNDALQWNIKSQMAGKIPVEIRYFTSGITWAADYVGIANEDETKLNLTGYVRVFNNSGELYDNAQTRLVVGTINLVEKIADLARRPPPGSRSRRRPRHAGTAQRSRSSWRRPKQPFGDAVRQAERRLPRTRGSRRTSSSRASPNTSSSPSKAARTSRTRSPSGWWP